MDYLERKKLFVLNLSVSLWQGDLAVRGERTPVSLGKLLAPYTVSRAIFQIWGAAYSTAGLLSFRKYGDFSRTSYIQ